MSQSLIIVAALRWEQRPSAADSVVSVTLNVRILIYSIKHRLIIKLIASIILAKVKERRTRLEKSHR